MTDSPVRQSIPEENMPSVKEEVPEENKPAEGYNPSQDKANFEDEGVGSIKEEIEEKEE